MSNKKSILIVEDEYYLAENVRMRLEFMGYQVHCVENGQLALDFFETGTVQLVLMDAMMPVMDGWDATKHLKENKKTKNIPVVFVTALARQEDQNRAFKLNADGYLTKPFEAEKLVEIVEKMIGKP